jgi:hypothetical protein
MRNCHKNEIFTILGENGSISTMVDLNGVTKFGLENYEIGPFTPMPNLHSLSQLL